MADSSTIPKVCVKCGKDVAGNKRMKDSMGRYWCLSCGAEDQKRKSAMAGATCDECGEGFPPSQISKWGNRKLCNGCVKRQKSGGGFSLKSLFSGGGGGEKKIPWKMLIFMGILGLVAAYMYWPQH